MKKSSSFQKLAAALLATALMTGTSAAGPASEHTTTAILGMPSTADELVAYVTVALTQHDLGAFERLVEWKNARPIRKRMTMAQILYSSGRPIKSASVEPFPANGLQEAKSLLNLEPNLPVTEQLRVVFDEPPTSYGGLPTSVFLLGKEDGVYRVSLLLSSGPSK